MSTLGRDRIRIAFDASKAAASVDVLTGATPEAWRGKDLQLEIGLFFGDSTPINAANLSSLTVTVKPVDNRTGNHALAQKTINAADIADTLVLADWNAGTAQHAIVSWDNSETNIVLTGDDDEFWVFVSALTADNPARKIPLGHTILKIIEPGDSSGSTPAPGDPNYYTAAQSDARYPRKHSFIINQANVTGGLISGLTDPLTITHNKNTKDWTWQVYRVDDDTPWDASLTPNNVNTASLSLGVVPGDGEFRFVGFYL